MPRQIHKLSAVEVTTLTKPGRYSDGAGLYLYVGLGIARSWVFMWKAAGRRREMGLGSARNVSLARARELAGLARKRIRDGADPTRSRHEFV